MNRWFSSLSCSVNWSLPKKMKPPFLLHGFWTGVCLGQTRNGFCFSWNWIFHSDTHDFEIPYNFNGFHYRYTQKFNVAPNSGATSQSETSSQPSTRQEVGTSTLAPVEVGIGRSHYLLTVVLHVASRISHPSTVYFPMSQNSLVTSHQPVIYH